jgi:hypothetical protein
MLRIVQRMRPEAVLVHRAVSYGVPMMVPPNGVGNGYPVHELRELIGAYWTHDQMPVIRHEAVRDEADRMQSNACRQDPKEGAIVVGPSEERQTTSAAIGHMEAGRKGVLTRTSGHSGPSACNRDAS